MQHEINYNNYAEQLGQCRVTSQYYLTLMLQGSQTIVNMIEYGVAYGNSQNTPLQLRTFVTDRYTDGSAVAHSEKQTFHSSAIRAIRNQVDTGLLFHHYATRKGYRVLILIAWKCVGWNNNNNNNNCLT